MPKADNIERERYLAAFLMKYETTNSRLILTLGVGRNVLGVPSERGRFHSETLNRLLILQSCLFGVPFFVTGIIRSPLCGPSVLRGTFAMSLTVILWPQEPLQETGLPPRHSSAISNVTPSHACHLSDKSPARAGGQIKCRSERALGDDVWPGKKKADLKTIFLAS